MGFMETVWLGVRVWIWIYLGFSILGLIAVAIYFFKEIIRKQYYKIRFPEKLLRIVIHYKTRHFKVYWRIIPDSDTFIIDGKTYAFNSKNIINPDDVFVKKTATGLSIKIDGKEYNIDTLLRIKNRWQTYPELHYFYNSPNPIDFDLSKNKIDFTGKQLKEFKENDLFSKLLTLDTQSMMMFIVLVVSAISAIISLVILARDLGWIS